MIQVQNLLTYMESLAPKALAMDWDNPGLQIGCPEQEVHKILIALDPFEGVCREAVQTGADLVITHHPMFFRPAKNITSSSATGRAAMTLIQNGISLFSAHTNLDIASGGINDVLAAKLGMKDVEVFGEENLLRKGSIPCQPLSAFLEKVKTALGCPGLRYADGGIPCRKIAVGGGACADSFWEAKLDGCDTFVTSDIKYNQFWDARDIGLNLIDAGHFYTENPIVAVLAEKIQAAFPDIQVEISKTHRDCMNFF